MSIHRPGGLGVAWNSCRTEAIVEKMVSTEGPALSKLALLALLTNSGKILGSEGECWYLGV